VAIALLLAAAAPAGAISRVDLVGLVPAGKPVAVAVDDAFRVYAAQKDDGTVWVISPEGALLAKLGGKDAAGKPILKRPSRVSVSGDRVYVADSSLDRIAIFSRDGAFLETIGNGSGNKSFSSPAGVLVHGGVIYVADTGNDRVQILGPNGVFMETIQKLPLQDPLGEPIDVAVTAGGAVVVLDGKVRAVRTFNARGEPTARFASFDEPTALAADAEGVYVADAGRYRVFKYTFDGKEIFAFGSKGKEKAQFLGEITGVALDAEGRVYVSDLDKGVVMVFRPDRAAVVADAGSPPQAVRWLGSVADAPVGEITWGSDGRLYAVSEKGDAILVFADGRLERTLPVPKTDLSSVARDAAGGLWVVDGNKERVLQVDDAGKVSKQISSGGSKEGYLDEPSDMAINSKGVIFVADRGNNRVQAFSPDGLCLQILNRDRTASGPPEPLAVAIDPEDNLYILDRLSRTVTMYAADGRLLGRFGGEKTFAKPVSLAVTRQEIFVLDAEAGEVKVFAKSGDYLRRFASRGTGRGDLMDPRSIAVKSETEILVADTGNGQVDLFGLIYTPTVPAELVARPGMRSVGLAWKPNPEAFVGEYRVYRGVDGGRQALLGVVAEPAYRDDGLEPERTYEYSVSAVARDGNEGGRGESVRAVPSRLMASAPGSLAAVTTEDVVSLTWAANAEPHVREYRVYREFDGIPRQVAATADTRFEEKGLENETAYVYHLTAVSTDGVESGRVTVKATTKAPTKPPIEIDIVNLNNVFSNSYKIYETEGIGRIRLTNNTVDRISRLKISFTMQNFMDFPWEVTIEDVPPGAGPEIPLKAVFNNNILQVSEDTPVQIEVKVTYFRSQRPITITRSHTINVFDKHRMMWDTKDRFAAFITPKDPPIIEFGRAVAVQYPEADNPLVSAGVLFEALGTLGMMYLADPSNPYQIVSERTDTVDYIQYPQETLKRNSGDCDDLVALYASILESLGIRAVVLDVPGHMFMMFSSTIPAMPGIDTMEGMFVEHDGQLWVPVEATLVGRPFIKAWEEGSKAYATWTGKGLSRMDIRALWDRFKPATLPAADLRIAVPPRGTAERVFPGEMKTLRKIWIKYKGYREVEALRREPDNVAALVNLGVLYGQAGELEESLELLGRAVELAPQNASAQNNYGNILFMSGKYAEAQAAYQVAAEIDRRDPYILVNLARVCLRAGEKKLASEAFARAVDLDPGVKGEFRGMAIELSGAY
jgi:DNA-binding beta-propeller fold protein YncE/tetratricopeptide (TPR) repeat protein